MTEENDFNTELVAEETAETQSLAVTLAPVAMTVGAVAGAVYLVRKYLRRNETATEVNVEAIEATSEEA